MATEAELKAHAEALMDALVKGRFRRFAARFLDGGEYSACTVGAETDENISGSAKNRRQIIRLAKGWVKLTAKRKIVERKFQLHAAAPDEQESEWVGLPPVPYSMSLITRYRAVVPDGSRRPVMVTVQATMYMADNGKVAFVQSVQDIQPA